MDAPKFRVAICGGGIGGLTLAVALSRYPNIRVDVYEAAGQFKEIGAGVMIWARTWEILSILGMADDFSRIAHAPPDGSPGVGFDYRKSDQPQEGSRFYLFEVPYGCIRFHRAQFLDVLVDHLPQDVAHFGKRLVNYRTTEHDTSTETELLFADGSVAACDILIGCDGIKSVVRKQMLEDHAREGSGDPRLLDHIEPVWSGSIAYRGLIPVGQMIRADGVEHRTIQSPMMYCGKSKHVVSYSISRGSIVNVVAMASRPDLYKSTYAGPWVVDCSREEVLECFAGWEPEVEEMLKRIEKPTKWAIHELKPLPFYTKGRVALLGDAAHAMCPHQGAGAGQAIEDAFILAEILGHPRATLSTIPQALAAYETVRLPMANHVLNGSRESGDMYEFNGSLGDDLVRLGPQIGSQWDWLWETTPEGEREKASQVLMSTIAPAARL
ncbi:FAD/NAD-P-binding domain-containing protein [Trametes versicolor FP-101664 SS1]|uniref:FAD/NAD-P-binding domain-containing protein n=1 Tax=Trametes versicolor (strain FP-101664) TaxID=717944 RepID=UPI00046233A3|nr:FAD/NAD-P-binding domain-containing protein [Trametes versicolor FP-101664 SS1]EIW63582.1 FAD/NAD-P-binding domain-containing protein [Trametes versicolor FP-101664 SS1]